MRYAAARVSAASITISILLLATPQLACSSGETTPADAVNEAPGAWWQLHDDSELTLDIDPWPPRSGEATLRVTATLGDWSDEILTERVSYRVAEIENGFDQWQPMANVDKTEEESRFEATTTLEPGRRFVQLKIEGSAYEEPVVLGDWAVDVK